MEDAVPLVPLFFIEPPDPPVPTVMVYVPPAIE
jgi:hypothetical protein